MPQPTSIRAERRRSVKNMARDLTQASHSANDLQCAITALIASWTDAWNAHDADALARLVAPDVEFVNVAGRWLRGRSEFLDWHRSIHQAHLKHSSWTTRQYRLRQVNRDLILAHLEWTIDGECGLDGSPRPPRNGIFSWMISRQADLWYIATAHNTNLAEGVCHRLSAAQRGASRSGGC